MTETMKNAEQAIGKIETCKATITTILSGLREQMPEVMAELDEAEASLPRLQEEAKVVLRELGAGNHEVCGHVINVKAAASSVKVDVEGLLERATERGDVQDLLDAGVLKYDVVSHQVGRLSSKMRVIYETYLSTKSGTAAVTLPGSLK